MAAWMPHSPSRLAASVRPAGVPPGAPSNVTSITKDGGATVSFLGPSVLGSGPVTSWTVIPYISGTAQTPTTVGAGSAGSITGSDGNTYVQVGVTGLTNSTAYTFTVKAANSAGTGPESSQSGANTPLSGLVFGDDFNGPAGGPVDPEWWIYTRCGYLAQSEAQYYLPAQVSLDGSSNLLLTATKTSYTGPSYPSAGGGTVTQPWRSGSVQSNTRTYTPAAGNTMTFETSWQICAQSGNGPWPSPWLAGSSYLTQWKTDPDEPGNNSTDQAEIDIAEWPYLSSTTSYGNNVYLGSSGSFQGTVSSATDLSLAQHVYTCRWKPGVSTTYLRDGTQTNTTTTAPASGANLFLLLYLQIDSRGSNTATQSCSIDYYRVFDQNLG